MNVDSIRLITFDCYGTLIDWETGMLRSLRPLFADAVRPINDLELLELYGDVEAEIEAGEYLAYRQVLARTVEEMGRRIGKPVSPDQAREFAQSLTEWEPFPDTVAALNRLAQRFKLGIISNVDDDLFAATHKKLRAPFELIVTAQQVESYKPSLKNFQEAMRRCGLKPEALLHAGQSVYHDIVPASFLGIANVWVNRPSLRPGAGAAKPAVAQPTLEVGSMAELATALLGEDQHSLRP
ncbi:MAG TPA: HAD-IA family hydrolase [Terriglobales bacterium]|nr:HAD-IA family hydrolase [Terriglobales bacterium]